MTKSEKTRTISQETIDKAEQIYMKYDADREEIFKQREAEIQRLNEEQQAVMCEAQKKLEELRQAKHAEMVKIGYFEA